MLTFELLRVVLPPLSPLRTSKKLWEQHTALEAMCVWEDLKEI
jgi:hypothetical protein